MAALRIAFSIVGILASSMAMTAKCTDPIPKDSSKPPAVEQTEKPAKPKTGKTRRGKIPDGGTIDYRSTKGPGGYLCAVLDAPDQTGKRGCAAVTDAQVAVCTVGLQWPTCWRDR